MKNGVMKVLKGAFIVGAFVVAGGCASALPNGIIYTDVKLPISSADGQVSYTRVGSAEAKSYFGLVAVGDASINQAILNGGIKKVKYIDYQSNGVLGVVGTYKTTVYGD